MERLQYGKVNNVTGVKFDRLVVGTATDGGTGVVNASGGVQIGGNGVKFTKRYFSGTQSITLAGGSLTLTHGLGVQPELTALYLRNVTGSNGYTAGDDVMIDVRQDQGADAGMAVVVGATDIFVRFSAAMYITNKTTGAVQAVTASQWSLLAYGWAT